MKQRILYLFTRTPLHVGAGSSVGAIDQPIQRERHTGFPIIPGSSIKGVMRDHCLVQGQGDDMTDWLFGPATTNKDENLGAGALQFSEAKLLAFPVRSARGCFAWVTSRLALGRFTRDLGHKELFKLPVDRIEDDQALYGGDSLNIDGNLVLEEYTFKIIGNPDNHSELKERLKGVFGNLLKGQDPVWQEFLARFVIMSDGMMSFFTNSACEVAQHTRIDDATGTVAHGALFNQENVPAETMFYSLVTCMNERNKKKQAGELKRDDDAEKALRQKMESCRNVIQIGGDSSTGLGLCSLVLDDVSAEAETVK